VTDANGNPIRTLREDDFTLLENGEQVDITDMSQAGEQGPVTAVLTIDRSGSMLDLGKMEAARQAALAFVDMMRPEDQTGVVVFNTQVEVVHPISSDQESLRSAIRGIQAFDDTALYDGLAESINLLQGVEGRKAIILLSDGLDNSSRQTLDSVMGAVNNSEVSIYTIGLGDPNAGLGSTSAVNEPALQTIADQSRGQYMYSPGPEGLQELYQQLSMRLQNEYRITYTTPNTLRNGVNRGVQVLIAPGAGPVVGEATSGTEFGYNPGGLIPETAETLGLPVFGVLLVLMALLLIVPDLLRTFRRRGAAAAKPSRVKLGKPAVSAAPTKKVPPDAPMKSVPPDAPMTGTSTGKPSTTRLGSKKS
jgi:VWFA-related protein